jgi:hypothetical protein
MSQALWACLPAAAAILRTSAYIVLVTAPSCKVSSSDQKLDAESGSGFWLRFP